MGTYSYVASNPLGGIDPRGLDTTTVRPFKPGPPLLPGPSGDSGGPPCPLRGVVDWGTWPTKINIFGWPREGLIQCFYDCSPPGKCPKNPEDYGVVVSISYIQIDPGYKPECAPSISRPAGY